MMFRLSLQPAAFAAILPLFLVDICLAQTASAAAGQPPSFSETMARMLPMFAMVFIIFYFMVIRPQSRKLLDHQKLMDSLKKGDAVTTTGGIIGRVATVEQDSVVLEVANNVRIKFERAHILKRASEKKEKKEQNQAA